MSVSGALLCARVCDTLDGIIRFFNRVSAFRALIVFIYTLSVCPSPGTLFLVPQWPCVVS